MLAALEHDIKLKLGNHVHSFGSKSKVNFFTHKILIDFDFFSIFYFFYFPSIGFFISAI